MFRNGKRIAGIWHGRLCLQPTSCCSTHLYAKHVSLICSLCLQDLVEGLVQRAEPYIPARLQQLVRPQADQTGAADAQPARLPLLVPSKPILAALCLMMLAALLLLGYGFHAITTASPRLTWLFASIIIMVSFPCLQTDTCCCCKQVSCKLPAAADVAWCLSLWCCPELCEGKAARGLKFCIAHC